jgi:hypothetical protein
MSSIIFRCSGVMLFSALQAWQVTPCSSHPEKNASKKQKIM